MSRPGFSSNLPVIHLGIGEGGLFHEPAQVHVLLGSCVAVTFHSPARAMGGTFHALMPVRAELADRDPAASPFKYVDSAIDRLCQDLLRRQIRPDELQVKVFGGANSLTLGEIGMGMKNVRTAFAALAERGLRVATSSVGGTRGRKLVFLPHTGEVFMKTLNETPVCGMRVGG